MSDILASATTPSSASSSSLESASDSSLLHARIAQLEGELSRALLENQSLRSQLMQAEVALYDEREIKAELAKANKALSDEVEELTRSLFVEANDMVERESQARHTLEMRHKKLEAELATTREQLHTQTQQLTELRSKLLASKSAIDLGELRGDQPVLTLRYYEDLFPRQNFCHNRRDSLPFLTLKSWDDIVQEIPDILFEHFANFVELASLNGLNDAFKDSNGQVRTMGKKKKCPEALVTDEKVLNHALMRSLFESDVEACFRFNPFAPIKSHSFLKKLVISLLANTCCIERVNSSEADGIFATPVANSMPTSPSNGANDEAPKKKSLKSLLMTLSVTSLPDSALAYASTEEDSSNTEDKLPCCALCKGPLKAADGRLGVIYRFRLSERDAHGWLFIDTPCRDRLVAVGDLYTFVRHIRRGLYAHRPIVDLYCELLHYLRNMFYARLGATSFYIRSDAELFYSKLNPGESPS